MTHSDLVKLAAKWLRRECSVVITEMATTGETPDAIGWHGTHSTLVECKTSVGDFRADAEKYFRREPSLGMGDHRYYCAPAGLISVHALPAGWGLLEVQNGRVRVTAKSAQFLETNTAAEKGILLSSLRRIGSAVRPEHCVSVKCYAMTSRNTATLWIDVDDNEKAGQVTTPPGQHPSTIHRLGRSHSQRRMKSRKPGSHGDSP